MRADLVLLDDKLARLHAQAQGLVVTGTVGLLLRAAERGLIEFEPAFRALLATGFHLSPAEVTRILALSRKPRP